MRTKFSEKQPKNPLLNAAPANRTPSAAIDSAQGLDKVTGRRCRNRNEYFREYRSRNRDKIRARMVDWQRNNPDKLAAYRARHAGAVRAFNAKYTAELADGYLRRLIAKGTGRPASAIAPAEILEKRVMLAAKRDRWARQKPETSSPETTL